MAAGVAGAGLAGRAELLQQAGEVGLGIAEGHRGGSSPLEPPEGVQE